ncbi:MAG: glycosyltransferase family 4 protein [Myxococcales bacterium]
MKTVLFLTLRMKMGFGVDVVVGQLSRLLIQRGHRVVVGCIESEPGFEGVQIEHVRATESDVAALASRVDASVIVAHTSPFFELLPGLTDRWPCWAWEHGDPTPALFDGDRDARAKVKALKAPIYPQLAGVIAISEFIRADIGFGPAHVIYNGCDHVPDTAAKALQDLAASSDRPLRVGTLLRIGAGEAFYKGNTLFQRFAAELQGVVSNVRVVAMGRGSEADARAFRDHGIEVILNAPDAEKWAYLRELDVFLSFSLWEGFNLPLIEAQALGTVGLAFDTGAHPEVTPMILRNVDDALSLVKAYSQNRELLLRHSRLCQDFVRRQFSWERCVQAFEELALGS